MSEDIHTGSCLCGGVAYELRGKLRPVTYCHCTQCQKTSGFHFAATQVSNDRFRLTRDDTLAWFQSSEMAERGFCNRCGASLFWRRSDEPNISITAGTIDQPTDLVPGPHIFTDSKGDYYDIPG